MIRMRISTLSATRKSLIALLAACCLLLSLVEHMIPKPVPFLRLGLANLPVLISLGLLTVPELLLLVTLKVLGQGVVNGTLFSYVFLLSASGSFASVFAMLVANKAAGRYISLVGVSMLGALASTVAQLALAALLVFGSSTRYIAPPFLASGLITAIVLGFMATAFCGRSRWYRSVQKGEIDAP